MNKNDESCLKFPKRFNCDFNISHLETRLKVSKFEGNTTKQTTKLKNKNQCNNKNMVGRKTTWCKQQQPGKTKKGQGQPQLDMQKMRTDWISQDLKKILRGMESFLCLEAGRREMRTDQVGEKTNCKFTCA